MTKDYPVQNVSGAKVEKPCFNQRAGNSEQTHVIGPTLLIAAFLSRLLNSVS